MCLPFSRRSIDFHCQSSINSILPTLFCPCNVSDVNKIFTVEFLIILSLCRGPCLRKILTKKNRESDPWLNCVFFLFSVIQQSCSRAVKAWEACDSRVFWRSHNLFQWNHGFYWPRFREYADGGKNHKLKCNFFFIIVKFAIVGIIFEIHL